MSKKATPKQIAVGRQLGKSFGLGAMYGGGKSVNMGGQNQLQRPHILMGTAAADMSNPMLNMLPHEQVRVQLFRHRLSIPFPCNTDEVYFESMPEWVKEWVNRGYFDKAPEDTRIANVVELMRPRVNRSIPTVDARENTVQMVIRWRSPIESELTFWMNISRNVPSVPGILGNRMLQYPPDGIHFADIIGWGAEAEALNEKIDAYTQFVKGYNDILSTAADVKAVWPELLSFVHFRNEHTPPVSESRKKKLISESRKKDQGLKGHIIDMLTTSAMLKENFTLPAWTGF